MVLLFISSAFFFSCGKPLGSVNYKNKSFSKTYKAPPGTIRIGENFYADEIELPNIYYREYLYWVKKVLGDSAYQANLPDTTVWRLTNGYNEPFVETYHQHPAFDMYPAVGVSYQQAKDYLKWRSDRVYEMMLIEREIIYPEYEQDPDNYFSIETYLSGNYLGYTPDTTTLPHFPLYRLPSEEEWEFLASGGLNTSSFPYGYNTTEGRIYKIMKRKKYQGFKMYNLKYPPDSIDKPKKPYPVTPTNVRSYLPNDFGIYNCIGNLAEMTAEEGTAKGGSYIHPESESVIVNRQEYNGPTPWLGFRGVCTWIPVTQLSHEKENQ